MSRKHNKPQQRPSDTTGQKSINEPASLDALDQLSDSTETASFQALSLQRSAGNRAVLDAMEARTQESEQESEELTEHAEKPSEGTQKADQEHHQNSARSPNRAAQNRLASSGPEGADWDLLLGGEDEPDSSRPPKSGRRILRRRLRSLATGETPTAKAAQETDPTDHAPCRPSSILPGYRRYYALEASLTDPERWINTDSSPESLSRLSRNHPLMRIQHCLNFWGNETGTPLSTLVIAQAQREPREVGHLHRTTRSLGLLLLLQELESERHGPQTVADATALLLQEKAIRDIRNIDEQAESLHTTDSLFQSLLPLSSRGTTPDSHKPVRKGLPCPLLSSALRCALPIPPPPAIITPYVTPQEHPDPECAEVDAIFQSLWETSQEQTSPTAFLQSADQLLDACIERRLWYASHAYALWRCRGEQTTVGLQAALVKADHRLREIATRIQHTQSQLEKCSSLTDILPHHRDLTDIRKGLQEIDDSTHQALILAASDLWNEPVKDTASERPRPEFLFMGPREGSASSSPDHPNENTENLGPTQHLFQAWCRSEQKLPSSGLEELLRTGTNPWLAIRRVLDEGAARHPKNRELAIFQDDPIVMTLLSACLEEACMNPTSKS